MPYDLFQVDAFTAAPFAGNPAAVCLCPEPREAAWMQRVAAEMNLSETAFLVPRPDGFDLRWFTPALEVDLCGHATLASAHALWESAWLAPTETARFHTQSGLLTASRVGDWIELDFPATPVEAAPDPFDLAAALGVKPVFIGRSRYDVFVEVATAEEVLAARPDFVALRALRARGVILTAAGKPPYDFISRFFAPGAGVDEDPTTGSAHCALGPFWGARLGKGEMLAHQSSARGGVVQVVLAGDRVLLRGQAVTVLRGLLFA
jgi:PhzF family phenazine biosynthesis protein